MKRLQIKAVRSQKGQTLPMVAFGLIVILSFAGLAIDGGNVYMQRRRMQNAADSGALAGARELALGATTNEAVRSAVESYVAKNGGEPSALDVEYVTATERIGSVASYGESSAPPSQATGVYVRSQTTYKTFFGGILGIQAKTSSAEAVGQAGSTGSLNKNLFPVAIDDDVLNNTTVGTVLKIWDENKTTTWTGESVSGQRGWLNFNFIYSSIDPNGRTEDPNYSTAELKNWVQGEFSERIYAGSTGGLDGDFIDGDPGVRDSTIHEAHARVGDVVFLPVFDNIYTRDFMQSNLTPAPSSGWAGGFGGSSYYHIVGFAAFQITDTSHGAQKYIAGKFLKRVVDGDVGGSLTANESAVSVNLSDIIPPMTQASSAQPAPSAPVNPGGASGFGG
ncbi:MAG: Tad domain-containing protein [Armatimonadetes bacterium]|nr:Tad domain-containing protein [Armatimonadota bacterium]